MINHWAERQREREREREETTHVPARMHFPCQDEYFRDSALVRQPLQLPVNFVEIPPARLVTSRSLAKVAVRTLVEALVCRDDCVARRVRNDLLPVRTNSVYIND